MGVLQRFERRLEGLVEGAFAHVFKGAVEPVEIARSLQREAADHKTILGPGRLLVPNHYLVELAAEDHQRLLTYAGPLAEELAGMLTEHIGEQGWTTYRPVQVTLEPAAELRIGIVRVSSSVATAPARHAEQQAAAGQAAPGGPAPAGQATPGAPADEAARWPTSARLRDGAGHEFPLRYGTTIVGRGEEADIRLPDVGISRRHARLAFDGTSAVLTDLRSTNGTLVNDRRVDEQLLHPGDRISLGETTLVFRADD